MIFVFGSIYHVHLLMSQVPPPSFPLISSPLPTGLLIAARMHDFRRTKQEVIRVVKIGDATLQRRYGRGEATRGGSQAGLTLLPYPVLSYPNWLYPMPCG